MIASSARADDQMTTLAQNGAWIAIAHRPTITAATDVCIAVDAQDNIAIRTDDTDIEVRYLNSSWSLPANVGGKFELAVDGRTFSFEITSNTNDQVTAVLTTAQLSSLVSGMSGASSKPIVAANGAPQTASLAGSGPVLSAFITCAGIFEPTIAGTGVDPMQPPPVTDVASAQPPSVSQDGVPPLPSPPPATTSNAGSGEVPTAVLSYYQGHADRVRLEKLDNSLQGAEKQGFVFWSAQRSLSNPMSCTDGANAAFPNDPNDEATFVQGCQEGQVQLAPTDVRRKTDALYRAGWNAPLTSADQVGD